MVSMAQVSVAVAVVMIKAFRVCWKVGTMTYET